MFGWFEQRLNPFPSEEPGLPPKGLVAFCWHYTKPAWPWLLLLGFCSMLIALFEVFLYQFLGNIVDWLSSADRATFLQNEGRHLFWMAALLLIGLPLAGAVHTVTMHQVLAGGQGALMASTPLTLAETASVFGEMLTFRSLLDATADKRERKAMLAQKVEDMINTVVRQIAFYEFERKVHTERRNGELTSDKLGQFWLEVQAESLGPAIRLREGYETFWTYIPHFIHSPFYVYAYAFGDCLVNSLYAVYRGSERGFQEKYFDMLKAGGTKHHSELLKPFGLDATDPSFWQIGLGVISGLIDELEALD